MLWLRADDPADLERQNVFDLRAVHTIAPATSILPHTSKRTCNGQWVLLLSVVSAATF